MYSLNDTVLESNKYLKINFDRGDLSSDAGLLLLKLLKIVARVVKSARYKYFKLCSSFPYKKNSMRHWKISEICTHSLNDNDQRTLISSQMTSYQCNRDKLPFFRQFSGRVRYYERIQDYGHVLNSKITVP